MWTKQQERARKDVARWLADPSRQPVYRLFGYAGTGKTTLARSLAEDVGGSTGFAAFTGKAASVMASKGCEGARTIHSLIYRPAPPSRSYLIELNAQYQERKDYLITEGRPVETDLVLAKLSGLIERERAGLKRPSFVLNTESDLGYLKLLVIDECSMVGKEMAEDLLTFGVPLLVLGDPAQLPPVGSEGFFINAKPDTLLTEIHRQARDNPIIDLATRVRQGEQLPYGSWGECDVIPRSDITPERALAADQILVGKNTTRRAINKRQRQLLGRSGLPVLGDRLVCLRNNPENGLRNGTVWEVVRVGDVGEEDMELELSPEGEDRSLTTRAHLSYFDPEVPEVEYWDHGKVDEFDFGYALTVHKSQGSQWDDVLLFDESRVFRSDWSKWLYTGITRAAKRLTVVR